MNSETAITTTLTILTGTGVVVLGHIFLKFFLEPMQDFKKEISQLKADLLIYEGVFKTPKPSAIAQQKARVALRRHAALVLAKADTIPCYKLFVLLRIVPKYSRILTTRQHLQELAAELGNEKVREAISKDLH